MYTYIYIHNIIYTYKHGNHGNLRAPPPMSASPGKKVRIMDDHGG